MRSDFSVVDQQMSRGGQDVTFKLLATFRLVGDDNKDITRKFRFEIKSDSYRQQCYARVEVWSKTSLCWNEVYRLRGEEMGLARLGGGGLSDGGVHQIDFGFEALVGHPIAEAADGLGGGGIAEDVDQGDIDLLGGGIGSLPGGEQHGIARGTGGDGCESCGHLP